jgi:hypothetical protein
MRSGNDPIVDPVHLDIKTSVVSGITVTAIVELRLVIVRIREVWIGLRQNFFPARISA